MNDRHRGGGVPPQGIRRRLPGDATMQYGPASPALPPQGGRSFDPRLPNRGRGRGGPGRGPPMPPPGRFAERGIDMGRGRGPPQDLAARGRGPPMYHPPSVPQRGMGPGMHRQENFGGKGPPGPRMAGRGPMAGRMAVHGMPPPPPPPLGLPNTGRGGTPSYRNPPRFHGAPPPPPPMHRPPPAQMIPPHANRPSPHAAVQPASIHMGHLQPPPRNQMPSGTHHHLPPGIPPAPLLHSRPPQSMSQPPGMGHAPPHNYQSHPTVHPPVAAPTQVPAPQSAHPPLSSYSQSQIDDAWTEHTDPKSRKYYYYNAITQESTYTKPDCLKTKDEVGEEKAEAPSVNGWTEYTDPSSGKKYYSDGTTTTWEKPDGFGADETNRDVKDYDNAPRKRVKKSPREDTEFGGKEEAIAAFKGLLLAKDVSPTSKWNEVSKLCSSDPRWKACSILSVGERKQALAEFQTKRANELRTMERQERMRAKEAFLDLLAEVLPSVEGFSPLMSRYTDMREHLIKTDRFHAVDNDDTRESLFLEFCEEFRKREERKKRNRKRDTKDKFLAFLKEHEESGKLSFASTWGSFLESLVDSEKEDSRFATSSAMSDLDRELYFADFVLELHATEDEKRRRIRDARRRAEKAQREAYHDMLQKLAVEGRIFPSSRWGGVESVLKGDPNYSHVHAQDPEAPREMFEDFVEEWDEIYRRDRATLSKLVYSPSKATSYHEFTKTLLDLAAHSPELYSEVRRCINRDDPVASALVYFNELRNGQPTKRASAPSSSEDEGEIREDGEVSDGEEITTLDKESSLALSNQLTVAPQGEIVSKQAD